MDSSSPSFGAKIYKYLSCHQLEKKWNLFFSTFLWPLYDDYGHVSKSYSGILWSRRCRAQGQQLKGGLKPRQGELGIIKSRWKIDPVDPYDRWPLLNHTLLKFNIEPENGTLE